MIAILDGECGNTQHLARSFDQLGVEAHVVDAIDAIERAGKIVVARGTSLPRTLRNLRDRQWVGPLLRAADEGRPILGIAYGMHALFDVSFEDGTHVGLGLVHGKVGPFDLGTHPAAQHFHIPHQGWNEVRWSSDCPLTAGLSPGEYFYFDHAAHAEPLDAADIHATCNHGIDFTAVIRHGHILGVQFLPEKSGDAGLKVLANFAAL